MKTQLPCIILPILILVTAVGCSKVSNENYNKLTVGMAYEEVRGILGNPDGCPETLGTKI
jgi:hypothetical protein